MSEELPPIEALVRQLYGLGMVQRDIGRHAMAGLGTEGFPAPPPPPGGRPPPGPRRRAPAGPQPADRAAGRRGLRRAPGGSPGPPRPDRGRDPYRPPRAARVA